MNVLLALRSSQCCDVKTCPKIYYVRIDLPVLSVLSLFMLIKKKRNATVPSLSVLVYLRVHTSTEVVRKADKMVFNPLAVSSKR